MDQAGKILVTGASGFVGSAVARALVRRGHNVRALVRATSPRAHLGSLDLEFVEGDLRDAQALRPALKSVRYLFHVAADYRLWARDPGEILRNNVTSTRNIMEAARAAGVERIVYTSSIATLIGKNLTAAADERTPQREDQMIGAYKKSKVAAERLVESFVASGLPAVIVNPTTPIGPGDVRPTPTGRIIVETASGRVPGFVDTGLNFVHVDDVAEGHLAAMDKGKIGERYVLGGDNATLAEFLAKVAEYSGQKRPTLRIPRLAVFPVAYAAEAAARLTGREPFITRDGLRMAKLRMFATSAKARRELGYSARPYAEGIRDALTWFGNAGYLKPRRDTGIAPSATAQVRP